MNILSRAAVKSILFIYKSIISVKMMLTHVGDFQAWERQWLIFFVSKNVLGVSGRVRQHKKIPSLGNWAV